MAWIRSIQNTGVIQDRIVTGTDYVEAKELSLPFEVAPSRHARPVPQNVPGNCFLSSVRNLVAIFSKPLREGWSSSFHSLAVRVS